MVGIAAWAFITTSAEQLSWERTLTRFGITVPLAALAAYAASQSRSHRDNERQARRTQLELAALDPYLALFPDEDKHALKKEIAPRLFGQPLPIGKGRDASPGVGQLIELLKDILSELRRGGG